MIRCTTSLLKLLLRSRFGKAECWVRLHCVKQLQKLTKIQILINLLVIFAKLATREEFVDGAE